MGSWVRLSTRLLTVVFISNLFLLFWCFFVCERWGSNKARHALLRIKTTFLTRYSSFSISLFFSIMCSSWSNQICITFSFLFFLLCYHDMIVILILHRTERVCTNRTHSTHFPFAYYVVYPTLPYLEPSLMILIILVHRVEHVCPNRTRSPQSPFTYDVEYATLPSIQPSFGHSMGWCTWS